MLECLKRVLYCEVFIKKSFLLFNVIYSVCSSHHARLMCMTYLNACEYAMFVGITEFDTHLLA